MGKRIGALTFLVRTGHGRDVERLSVTLADFVVDDLRGAAEVIAKLSQG